jgi:hypothetical protein
MLGKLGTMELVLLGIIVLSGLSVVRRLISSKGVSNVLVLRKFYVDPSDPDDVWIQISGRSSGLLSWLSVLLGLADQTELRVTKDGVSLSRSSLYGESIAVVPLEHISSTECGYRKPFWLLVVSGGLLIPAVTRFLVRGDYDQYGGIELACGMIEAFIAAIALVAYYLKKTFEIKVETGGSKEVGVSFKRSVIENVAVELPQAREVIELINQKVRDAAKSSPLRESHIVHKNGTALSVPV